MRFIRDIISEKRGLRPAVAPIPAEAGEADRPAERLAEPRSELHEAPPRPFNLFDEAEATEDLSLFPEVEDEVVEDPFADADAGVVPASVPSVIRGGPEMERDASAFDAEGTQRQGAGTLVLEAQALRGPKPGAPFDRLRAGTELEDTAALQEADLLRRTMAAAPRPEVAWHVDPAPAPLAAPAPAAEPAGQRGLADLPFVTARPEEGMTGAGVQVPPPAAGRASNRSGRVKTRLLGFNPESLGLASPFEKEQNRVNDTFPVGWLVVVAGPGRGASFSLHDGVSRIGRGGDQTVSLNFGDSAISRENHVAVAFDSEANGFFIGQSGKSNIVRLNNRPLLSTEQLKSGDQIRVGETTLRLVTLCGDGFSWAVAG